MWSTYLYFLFCFFGGGRPGFSRRDCYFFFFLSPLFFHWTDGPRTVGSRVRLDSRRVGHQTGSFFISFFRVRPLATDCIRRWYRDHLMPVASTLSGCARRDQTRYPAIYGGRTCSRRVPAPAPAAEAADARPAATAASYRTETTGN